MEKLLLAARVLGANNFLLARYLTDGTLDTKFGDNGIVLTDITDKSEFINSITFTN